MPTKSNGTMMFFSAHLSSVSRWIGAKSTSCTAMRRSASRSSLAAVAYERTRLRLMTSWPRAAPPRTRLATSVKSAAFVRATRATDSYSRPSASRERFAPTESARSSRRSSTVANSVDASKLLRESAASRSRSAWVALAPMYFDTSYGEATASAPATPASASRGATRRVSSAESATALRSSTLAGDAALAHASTVRAKSSEAGTRCLPRTTCTTLSSTAYRREREFASPAAAWLMMPRASLSRKVANDVSSRLPPARDAYARAKSLVSNSRKNAPIDAASKKTSRSSGIASLKSELRTAATMSASTADKPTIDACSVPAASGDSAAAPPLRSAYSGLLTWSTMFDRKTLIEFWRSASLPAAAERRYSGSDAASKSGCCAVTSERAAFHRFSAARAYVFAVARTDGAMNDVAGKSATAAIVRSPADEPKPAGR